MPESFQLDLLLILGGALLANIACRRLGVSTLIGYLVAGLVLGRGVLNLVSGGDENVELLAEVGVFLLLFTVGLEFSVDEMLQLSWRLPVAGATQMLLVAAPVGLACWWGGLPPGAAAVVGSAVAFSSTVLVFKTLSEVGQSTTPHGRLSIGVLLFQDMALVPLLLVLPLLTGDRAPSAQDAGGLVVRSVVFVTLVGAARAAVARWAIPALAAARSLDVVILATLVTLGLVTSVAFALGLPPALGAFAAGLVFGGNRLTPQIDAVVLPFRETFAASFFIALGLAVNPSVALSGPVGFLASLAAVIAIKLLAAAVALRLTGLPTKSALGAGLGLAHVGEFSFVLGMEAASKGVFSELIEQRLSAVALASLLLTPLMLRWGLRQVDPWTAVATADRAGPHTPQPELAVVIGIGPIGKQIASFLETQGVDVAMVDRSPVNLYPYAQAGFHTVAGDALETDVLLRAHAPEAGLIVVCVPADVDALAIVRSARALAPKARLVVRCRYGTSVAAIKKAGAELVVSEEQQAYARLIAHLAPGRHDPPPG